MGDLSDAAVHSSKHQMNESLQFVPVTSKSKKKKYLQTKQQSFEIKTPISTPDLQSAEMKQNDDDLMDALALNADDAKSSDLDADTQSDEENGSAVPVMTMKGKRRKSGVDDLDIIQFAQSYGSDNKVNQEEQKEEPKLQQMESVLSELSIADTQREELNVDEDGNNADDEQGIEDDDDAKECEDI